MAKMLSNIGRQNWNCRCCNPDKPDHGIIRQREKRVTQKWLDEYESEADMFMCPRDGLPCTCNRIEC